MWFNRGMASHDLATIRRIRGIARLLGALAGMIAGVLYSTYILAHSNSLFNGNQAVALAAVLAAGVAASATLALAAPRLTVDPYIWLRDVLERAPPAEVAGAVAGLVIALVISALVAILLSGVPWGLGAIVSLSLACALVDVGVGVGRRRGLAFTHLLTTRPGAAALSASEALPDRPEPQDGLPIVVDTSVLIDGRIVAVVAAGFVQGRLLVPRFVLEELQGVADSPNPVRRAKGRRGLDVVETLKGGRDVACEVIDIDVNATADVDSRLVTGARLRGAALLTVDYNLDRVAGLAGVRVLNLNRLAASLKPAVIAGETLSVSIIKDGREANQGIGYLEDGTMVVVENGRGRTGAPLAVTVSSVLQTSSGRLVFAAARPVAEQPAPSGPASRAAAAAKS